MTNYDKTQVAPPPQAPQQPQQHQQPQQQMTAEQQVYTRFSEGWGRADTMSKTGAVIFVAGLCIAFLGLMTFGMPTRGLGDQMITVIAAPMGLFAGLSISALGLVLRTLASILLAVSDMGYHASIAALKK